MVYVYQCMECGECIEVHKKLEDLEDVSEPVYACGKCSTKECTVYRTRVLSPLPFKVKGANAANGYSDHLGDDPNFNSDTFSQNDLDID